MVVRVDSGEKFYCGKNWAEQPACRTNMGAVKWSMLAPVAICTQDVFAGTLSRYPSDRCT